MQLRIIKKQFVQGTRLPTAIIKVLVIIYKKIQIMDILIAFITINIHCK